MKYKNTFLFVFIFLFGIIVFLFSTMRPLFTPIKEGLFSKFSTIRSFEQIKKIAEKPHFVGSKNHDIVAEYLQEELKYLGLKPIIQEGFSFSSNGTLTKCKNIIARIKGTNNNKALLLLSHYDSAPHSMSNGASDTASGIATILEGIRTFLYTKTPHKNDIILLFTDAEEIGLNGATLFVTKHQWAKEIGLALNFEARGTSGPSYMLIETNNGNAQLVNDFDNAQAPYPVSNSLMYSIYKMLPNDTDLTIFRENKNIQGFNFAFIDNHFNYHTAQDNSNNVDKNSIEHQASYLMSLLHYFSNVDLSKTVSKKDEVYFSIPFTFIHYPFDWVFPMLIIAFILFFILIIIGIAKRVLSFDEIIKGAVPFFLSVVLAGIIAYFGWKIILNIYPNYNDLLQGFTYNGMDYIIGFVLLSIAISFGFYSLYSSVKETINYYVVPLFFWFIITTWIAFQLKGAGFLIIPVFAALTILAIQINSQKSNLFLKLVLCIPILFILAPFVYMLPVALGLKLLFGSAILTVLIFSLLLPIFDLFVNKSILFLLFLVLSIGFFIKAHYNSQYQPNKAKPNSLVYFLDVNKKKAFWTTYDKNLDYWTKKYLGEHPKKANFTHYTLDSKYNSNFTYMKETNLKTILGPKIEFLKDSVVKNNRFLKIRISPNRTVNRYDIFANPNLIIHNFKANGQTITGQKGIDYKRNGKCILKYYVVDNLPLEMEFSINALSVFDFELIESSFDLLTNPNFFIQKRSNWMMPTPFVINDAILIKQKIDKRKYIKKVNPQIKFIKKQKNVKKPLDTVSISIKPVSIIKNE